MTECASNSSSTSTIELRTILKKVPRKAGLPKVDNHSNNENVPSGIIGYQKHRDIEDQASGSNENVSLEVEDCIAIKMEVDRVIVKAEMNEIIEVSNIISGSREFIQEEEKFQMDVLETLPELPHHLFSGGTEESSDMNGENVIEHDTRGTQPRVKPKGKPSTVYRCSFCKYKTIQKSHFQEHILIHSSTKLLKCPHCDYACNRRRILKSHLLVHAETKLFRCAKCDYECNYKSSLNTHILSHSNIKLFRCSECEYGTNWKKDLARHFMIHSKPKSRFIKCPKCDHVSSNKVNFQKHFLTHSEEKSFQCSECDFQCEEENSLKAHSTTHSKRNKQSSEILCPSTTACS